MALGKAPNPNSKKFLARKEALTKKSIKLKQKGFNAMMVNGELLVKLPSVKIDRFEGDNEYFGVDEAGFLVGRIKDRLKLVKLDT